MPRGGNWSHDEVEACVACYLRMLTLELNGQSYNKAAQVRALMPLLDNRSHQSIEFKHANISAVMLDLGYPSINGYKPRGNYQALLLDVLESRLPRDDALQDAVQAAVTRPALKVTIEGDTTPWVPAPVPAQVRESPSIYTPRFSIAQRDYLAQEARNRSLGHAGELFVLEIEARRLYAAGKPALGNRVEHVAATQGDGSGYDVLSFEADGRERLIEVKTTAFGELTPFYVSRNELARSERDAGQYHLYRVFDFRHRPRLFGLSGAIGTHCQLDPVSYLARVGG